MMFRRRRISISSCISEVTTVKQNKHMDGAICIFWFSILIKFHSYKQLQIQPEKGFSGLQRDSNPWPLRRAAVLCQRSHVGPYIGLFRAEFAIA